MTAMVSLVSMTLQGVAQAPAAAATLAATPVAGAGPVVPFADVLDAAGAATQDKREGALNQELVDVDANPVDVHGSTQGAHGRARGTIRGDVDTGGRVDAPADRGTGVDQSAPLVVQTAPLVLQSATPSPTTVSQAGVPRGDRSAVNGVDLRPAAGAQQHASSMGVPQGNPQQAVAVQQQVAQPQVSQGNLRTAYISQDDARPQASQGSPRPGEVPQTVTQSQFSQGLARVDHPITTNDPDIAPSSAPADAIADADANAKADGVDKSLALPAADVPAVRADGVPAAAAATSAPAAVAIQPAAGAPTVIGPPVTGPSVAPAVAARAVTTPAVAVLAATASAATASAATAPANAAPAGTATAVTATAVTDPTVAHTVAPVQTRAVGSNVPAAVPGAVAASAAPAFALPTPLTPRRATSTVDAVAGPDVAAGRPTPLDASVIVNATPAAPQPLATTPTVAPPAVAAALPPELPQPALAGAISRLQRGPDGVHQLEVALHPADLGSVRVRVTISHGALDVTVACADPAAREAVNAALPALHRDLAGLGRVDITNDRHPADSSFAGSQRDDRSTPDNPDQPSRDQPRRQQPASDDDFDRWM